MRKEPKLQFLVDMEERVRPVMEKIQETADKIYGHKNETFMSPPVTLPPQAYFPIPLSRTASSAEILYTKDKEFVRTVAGKRLIYAFMDKKRAIVLEHLLETDDQYVSTSTLISVSRSPSAAALRKLVQGINTAVKNRLKLKENIVVGRQGFGYKINQNLTVVRA